MTRGEFEMSFKSLYLPLGMYALRLIGDVDEAEDAVQEAFFKAWQKIGQGVEINGFKAYIYRAVHNECVGRLRNSVPLAAIESVADISDEDIDTSERDVVLWSAIDALPERCRDIFLMSKRDGMSNAGIADELGISVKTVENQMTKAFSRLREALAPERKVFFLPFL